MIRKILFIEDETHIAELYALVLKRAGYDVVVVNDGAEGFKVAQKDDFDLLLLDLMLPNMSGEDILYSLRDPKRSPKFKARIVVLTNFGEDDATRRKMAELTDGYLLKVNYTPRALVEFIKKIDQNKA